jgi:hypothetical protein
MRGLIAGVALVLFSIAPAADATGTAGLRLYTSHGTFRIAGAVSATESNSHGGGAMDGLLNPNTPPVPLRLHEPVRLSLPAQTGRVVSYKSVRLQLGNRLSDLDVAHPVWRPAKSGTYVVSFLLEATWKSQTDGGTTRSNWAVKVHVAPSS